MILSNILVLKISMKKNEEHTSSNIYIVQKCIVINESVRKDECLRKDVSLHIKFVIA